MSDGWGSDLLAVVERRSDVLAALAAPTRKRALVAELDNSRSTVDRAVRELEALDLAIRDDGGYRRTVGGRLALELYEEVLADLDGVAAAGDLLAVLEPDAPMSPAVLRGATVERAEPPSPSEALDPVVALFEEAEEIRGLSKAATRPGALVEQFERRIGEGASFEYVFTDRMAEYLRSNYADEIAALRATDDFEAYRTDESIPYGLGLAVDGDRHHTFLALYDDDHALQGTILTDTPEAYNWAERIYERYRAAAAPLALP